MHRTDATARPGSDNRMPDTTSPKMTKTVSRLHVLVKIVELNRTMAGVYSEPTMDGFSGYETQLWTQIRSCRGSPWRFRVGHKPWDRQTVPGAQYRRLPAR